MDAPLTYRFFTALGANFCFLFLLTMANTTLSGSGLYLFWGAAIVLYPALRLPLILGLIATTLSTLLLVSSLPPSLHPLGLIFIFSHVFIWRFRDHLNRDPWPKKMAVVLTINLICWIALFLQGLPGPTGQGGRYVLRVFMDGLVSNLTFPFILLWFWKGQKAALLLLEPIYSPRFQGAARHAR
jgi:hypothetical protein